VTGIGSLIGAIALIGFGGLFAAIDAAISTVSIARVEESGAGLIPGYAYSAPAEDLKLKK